MENFSYYSPTEFVFGRGAENQTGKLAVKYGAHKVMIVYGKGSAVRSGLLDRVKQVLDEEHLSYVELSGVQANPETLKVREGISLARQEHPDLLLALGGGSVIDTAKAIAVGYYYEGDFWDFYIGKSTPTKALKVADVLTIPAAGSEGSGNSVITDEQAQQKLSIRQPELLRPVFSIMNPELTITLPPFQTACGISDMMAHIMERYFSNTKDVSLTDRLCEALLLSIIEMAPRVMNNPKDYGARANIMWAGTQAHIGMCGVGREEDWGSHFIEHELSAIQSNIAHGAGLSVVYPAWLSFAARTNPEKIAQMAERVWGVRSSADPGAMAREGIERLKIFFHSIGLPTTLSELTSEPLDLDKVNTNLHRNKGEVFGSYVKLNTEVSRTVLDLCK
jgi:alcohol dehydrogenase YqhD (iron-dependent ADH family)